MKRIAKISGIAYVMIFISGFYANFSILESLVDMNAPALTLTNLVNGHSQFGYGLLGFLVMLLFDIVLVWSLFYLTKSVSRYLSYVASLFRLLHAIFFGIALSKLWKAYQLTHNADMGTGMEQEIMQLLSGFDVIWTIGLLIFGLHLFVLGFLGLKSTIIPKIIGLLLILAAVGYLIDGIAKLTFENYDQYQSYFEAGVVMTGVIGELSFTIWLLVKGLKKEGSMKFEKTE
ncbi:DUF4386 domain-containing protein [Arenibacter sp. F20364]|uniref:DUF4386 domain-containing protein n=1 Tax=Arenibacter sp. F20364 TaxID=2926415 RepID=UPI001FF37402|nr:DUF4386 domain-containing protein [Arenibacter sp. F20364]MCK0190437.1 DUF4386 domain-containing protein [Arenibacter sp. F20364]